ncbi:unnamed protein product [Nippostrongylus brasiliensis]|uniref:ANF_receptor domain-containing protein n=1 Tax=Nippostrongylus brasiliensis TaxID=27835 RepID=A0A0N4XVV3_NIPBR|nr:unnamed protein product [Nippostrongylus brasiliensis]
MAAVEHVAHKRCLEGWRLSYSLGFVSAVVAMASSWRWIFGELLCQLLLEERIVDVFSFELKLTDNADEFFAQALLILEAFGARRPDDGFGWTLLSGGLTPSLRRPIICNNTNTTNKIVGSSWKLRGADGVGGVAGGGAGGEADGAADGAAVGGTCSGEAGGQAGGVAVWGNS